MSDVSQETKTLLADRVDELRRFLEQHGARAITAADEPLIAETARNLIIADQIRECIGLRGHVDADGRPRGVLKMLSTVQSALTRQLAALGCANEEISRGARFVDPQRTLLHRMAQRWCVEHRSNDIKAGLLAVSAEYERITKEPESFADIPPDVKRIARTLVDIRRELAEEKRDHPERFGVRPDGTTYRVSTEITRGEKK